VLLWFCLFAGLTSAQVLELGVSGGASQLSNSTLSQPESAKLNSGFRLTFRVVINPQEHFGHEVGYAYNRTNLNYAGATYGMATHQGYYNFVAYALKDTYKVRPFIAGGGQFSNFVPPGGSASYGQGYTKFGVNYGGGVKVRVSERFLVRLDFHQFLSPKPDFGFINAPQGWLRMNEVSVGFAYTMGG
jgi:hypothetical protein